MIVEYFGIPGSGKTYQVKLYKQFLKLEGKQFLDISRFCGMPLWLKVFYKIADSVILVLPKYRKQFSEYKKLCKDCREESRFVPLSLNACIKDIVLYSMINDMFQHSNKIIINDEGQLHRVIFLIVQFNCSFEHAFGIYQSHKNKGIVRYIKTSSEQAFQNIKKRNRKVCPMDEMNDNLLKDYINAFKKVCEDVIHKDNNEVEII